MKSSQLKLNRLAYASMLLGVVSCRYQGAQPLQPETDARCDTCVIERVLLATISDNILDVPAFGDNMDVHVTSDTAFLVFAGTANQAVFFAHRGREGVLTLDSLRSAFRFPRFVLERPGSFVIFDTGEWRSTEFDKNHLVPLSESPIPRGEIKDKPLLADDGGYIIAATIPTRERAGYRYHRVGWDGQVLESFGEDPLSGPGYLDPTGIAASGDGFWAYAHDKYRFEQWSFALELQRVVTRPEPIGSVLPKQFGDTIQQSVTIQGIHDDGHGRLWVHYAIRAPVEREITVQLRDGSTEVRKITRVDMDRRRNASVIDVFDIQSRTLITSLTLREWRASSVPGGFFVKTQETTASGQPVVDIWGFKLRARKPAEWALKR